MSRTERTGTLRAAVGAATLAHLRHELRTPVNAILGYSEMLLEDAQSGEHASMAADLEKIRAAGAELRDLVSLLLDPTRVESSLAGLDIEELESRLRHDLRVPVNTVRGYAELLLEEVGAAPSQLRSDLQTIHAAGGRLLEVVDRIQHLARLDASELEVTHEATAAARDAVHWLRPGRPPEPPPAAGQQGRVLVVDDNATNRDLLQRRLSREGYRVETAGDGREALARLQQEAFDLVLLDIMMPEINGYEALQRLKEDEALRHLPVIMISALDEIDSVARCIELGAEDYLPKPCEPVLLRARVGSSLEKKRLRDREQAYLEELRRERERSEKLLLSILPHPIAERLKRGETAIADSFPQVTVLFADLCDFTDFAIRTTPVEVVRQLNQIFSLFDRLAEQHGLEKIKTIGDAYMVVGGAPTPREDHARAVAEMALDMVQAVERHAAGFRLRVGMHSGPVVAGVVGTTKFAYDLWGDTVNTASRMESHGLPGAVHLSSDSAALLGDGYRLEARGDVQVKGKGRMSTFLLAGRR